MLPFIIQSADLLAYGMVGAFFVYFLLSWSIYALKLLRARQYKAHEKPWGGYQQPAISIIIPVYNEKREVWSAVLNRIALATVGARHEIIVVANGDVSLKNAHAAEDAGFRTLYLPEADKRKAIAAGAKLAKYPISIILDSDTLVSKDSLEKLLYPFYDKSVGGVTPRQVVFDRKPLMRRMSDWLEDNRFNEVAKGQSLGGAVSCLPGRLFALRTTELKKAAPYLVSQTFLGMRCISGDDRFLTSWLLSHGFKTVYQHSSVVYTDAPDNLKGFIKQRLRWSRGSLRGTIKALPWLWRHPFTFLIVMKNVFMRWFLFVIILNALSTGKVFGSTEHWFSHTYPIFNNTLVLIGVLVVGLYAGGILKRIRHLIHYPEDILYYPVFITLVTFVLTPLEWYGNLTCWKQGWLTRTSTKIPQQSLPQATSASDVPMNLEVPQRPQTT